MSKRFAILAIDVAIVAILFVFAWTVHVALSDTNRPVDTIPPPAYHVEEPVYVVDP